MGKHSIQVQEIIRVIPENAQNQQRNAALLGNLTHVIAEQKVISLLYLSLGGAARKTLTDRYPAMEITTVELRTLLERCQETFQIERNRCLGRMKFFHRKQQPGETLSQFWHALNGLG